MNKHLDTAAKYIVDGVPWRALVELGAVIACVDELHGIVGKRARELAGQLAPADKVLRLEAKKSQDRLLHLVSFAGNRFEVEELVLMLTLRIELALAALASHELLQDDLSLDLARADEGLMAIASATASRIAYRRSVSLVEKNWRRDTPFDLDRLGITDIWSAAS